MATKISETLFDTIKIIAQDEVKKGAKYDVTKIFTIVDDTSRDIGKYIVENSTLTFDVYGESNAYYKGDQVRVTIPEGDYSQKKYIIGKHVAEEGKGLVQYASPVSSVLKTSNNVLKEDNRDVKGLIANGDDTILLLAEIDLTKNNYTNNVSDTLLIQADFQTFLEKYSITQGNYGLKVVVLYDNDEKYYDVYSLDSSEMFGNPYLFSIFTTQAKKFKLDANLSKNITQISLYLYQNNNFSYRDEMTGESALIPAAILPNLLVKDIVINFGVDLYGLDDNTLKLLVSGNNFYNKNESTRNLSLVWYNKDNLNSYIGFSDGIFLDDGYAEAKYKENNDIENSDNRYYYYFYKQDAAAEGDVIAGPGWELIAEGQPQENINCTYEFEANDFNKQEITFRGILFYNHERFEADNVTIKNAKDLIGDLNDKIEASENGTLVINHGADSQDVYNVYGADYLIESRILSMTSRELLIDMLFPEDSGLDINILHNSRLVWEVPIRNTMLTVSNEKNTFFIQETDNDKGVKRYILEKMNLDNDSIDDYHLFYSIADLYSPAKINNNIKCIITTPNGQVYSANKTFIFTQSETYGTKYVLMLYPMPDSPIAFVSGEASKVILGVGLWDENGVSIPIYLNKNIISSEYAIEPTATFDTNIDDATAVFVKYIPDDSKKPITAIELTSSPNLVDGAIINFSINYNGTVLGTNYALPCTSNLDYVLSGATKVIYNNLGTDPIFVQDAYKLFDVNNAELEPIFWHTLIDGAIDDENPLYPRLSNNKLVPSNIFIEDLSKEVYIQAFDAADNLLWSQPIVIEMNRYSNQMVNEWDGILAVNKEAGTVLAPMIGAGKKDSENSFSGVFMGQVEESEGTKLPIGLYGYNKGELNFGLKNDGTAFFGKSGGGRILLNGNDSTITSASYENEGPGVKIDLDGGADSPFFHIRGSHQNLIYIDNNEYYLQSDNFGFDKLKKITGLQLDLTKGQLYAGNFLIDARPADGDGVVYLNSNPSIGEDYMHIGNTDQYIKFTQDGQLYVTAGNLQISENKFAFNNFTIDDNGLRYITPKGETLLELGTQNIIQSSNFKKTTSTTAGTGMQINLGSGSITSHSFALDSNNLKVGTNFFQVNTANLKLNTNPANGDYWFYVGNGGKGSRGDQSLGFKKNKDGGTLKIVTDTFNLTSNNIIMQSGNDVQFTIKSGDDIYFQVGSDGKTIIGGWTVTPNSFSVIQTPDSDEEKAPYFRSEFVSYLIPNYGSSRNGGDSDDSYIYCEYSYPVAEFTSNAAGGCGLKIGRQREPLYIARDFGEEGGEGEIYSYKDTDPQPVSPLFSVDGFGNTSAPSMTITGMSGLSFKQMGSVAFEPITSREGEGFGENDYIDAAEAKALYAAPEIFGLRIVGYSGYEDHKKPIKIVIEGDLHVNGNIYRNGAAIK